MAICIETVIKNVEPLLKLKHKKDEFSNNTGSLTVRVKSQHSRMAPLRLECVTKTIRRRSDIPLSDDLRIILCNPLSKELQSVMHCNNLNFIDMAGNYRIIHKGYCLLCSGKTQSPLYDQEAKSLTKGMMGIIFVLLCEPEVLQQSQRTLATKAGASLGMVNKTLNYLRKMPLLPKDQHMTTFYYNKLIDKWLRHYDQFIAKSSSPRPLTQKEKSRLHRNDYVICNVDETPYLSIGQSVTYKHAIAYQHRNELYSPYNLDLDTLTLREKFWGEEMVITDRALKILQLAEALTQKETGDMNRAIALTKDLGLKTSILDI